MTFLLIICSTSSLNLKESCDCTHCISFFAFVPPQGCEAILIEILQPKQDC